MAAGELSVAEMKKRIEAGNVISYRGRIIKNVRDLPKEEEHATTLEEKLMAARKLQREIDEREQQLAPLMRDIRDAQGQAQGQQPQQSNTSSATTPVTQQQQTNTAAVTPSNQQQVAPSTDATTEANILPNESASGSEQQHAGANTTNEQQPAAQQNQGNVAPPADPKFLKKPLSYWRDLTAKAESEQAARQLIAKQGANEQATQQIIDALKAKPAAAADAS